MTLIIITSSSVRFHYHIQQFLILFRPTTHESVTWRLFWSSNETAGNPLPRTKPPPREQIRPQHIFFWSICVWLDAYSSAHTAFLLMCLYFSERKVTTLAWACDILVSSFAECSSTPLVMFFCTWHMCMSFFVDNRKGINARKSAIPLMSRSF